MTTINLRDYYPFYRKDVYIEVTEDVAEALEQSVRTEKSQQVQRYRHKAHFSLDRADGIDLECVNKPLTPEAIYMQNAVCDDLHAAMRTLSAKQAKRIYERFYLEKSGAEIARTEGVSRTAVNLSVEYALERMKELCKTLQE